MYFKNILFVAFATSFSFIFSSCKKDDHDHSPQATANNFKLEFDNIVGGAQLALDSTGQTFTNGSGEKFSITQLNYYVTNIRFRKTDGSEYVVPQDQSYFMVQENVEASQIISIPNVPNGEYNQVSFTLGVDSLRSTMDVSRRIGVLDPAFLSGHGMYWSWNSGYIFMKMEGISPSAPDSLGKGFFYHIGGFGGYNSKTINNIKTISLDLPTVATVKSDVSPMAHIMVDVKKVFDGSIPLKISEFPMVMFGPKSVEIANNYASMFMVHHIHNDHDH